MRPSADHYNPTKRRRFDHASTSTSGAHLSSAAAETSAPTNGGASAHHYSQGQHNLRSNQPQFQLPNASFQHQLPFTTSSNAHPIPDIASFTPRSPHMSRNPVSRAPPQQPPHPQPHQPSHLDDATLRNPNRLPGGTLIPSLIGTHMQTAAANGSTPRNRDAFSSFHPNASTGMNESSTLPPLSSLPVNPSLPPFPAFAGAPPFSSIDTFHSQPPHSSLPTPAHPVPNHQDPHSTRADERAILGRLPPAHMNRANSVYTSTNTTDGSLSIRQIHPVREALAQLNDKSPIIHALTQVVMQTGHVSSISPAAQRDVVLNFKGFSPSANPHYNWLTALSKNDLDILAWAFVVSKNGRKDEIARRIVSSLRAPLKYRAPTAARRPPIPARMEARSNANGVQGSTQSARYPTNYRPSQNRGRGSMMANLVSAADLPSAQNSILDNLTRQLSSDIHGGNTNHARGNSQANRNKHMHSVCREILQGYQFMEGENPFNCPLNPPLGDEKYVVFSSMQLSRGVEDPVLKFFTPSPVDAADRPEAKGGNIEVHIRCLRVDSEKPRTEWKQAWPFPASCRVNGQSVTLNQAQRYTNGKLAGRDAATSITPFLRKFTATGVKQLNKVILRRQPSSASNASGHFVFFAQEILVLRHETMMKRTEEGSEKYWQECRQKFEDEGKIRHNSTLFEMAQHGVMQFLTDPDGLTVSSMKVSLRCPLALTRISKPVKGKTCKHVQCFDLSNFLEYSRRSSKFDCPVCNKPYAFPSLLVISPYIEHALREFPDCDEVEIFQDGRMERVERKQTGVASDEEDDESKETLENNSGPQRAAAGASSKHTEVVDLTLDSDDDGDGDIDDHPSNSRNAGQASNQNPFQGRSDYISGVVTNNGNSDGEVQAAEQDIDFTFRADFLPWTEQPATGAVYGHSVNGRSTPQENSNPRETWTCDVIALDDSD